MHHSSFQQNPPHNASFVSATPIPEQYPPTMGAHSMRPPPPLDMSQVYHSNNNRASISSHYSNSNLHDSHRSRRISVVTSSDWKVSSRRPASRMEKTCSESFIEQQQSSRASIIEPRTPAYTPYTPNHHHSNSYFPSQQQQQQQQMVASPQDYRTMTSPLPTPGTDQQRQSFVGGFVIPPPIVQQPCYPPQVLPSSQQHPPSLHQRRQSSFVEALPSSSSSSSASSYPYRRSMPPPPIAKMSLGPSGAQTQTLPSRVTSTSDMSTMPAKPIPPTPAATTTTQQQQPSSNIQKKKKNLGPFANKEKRQITVQSINEEHRVWIDIAPNETGASLAHKIHVIATFRTKKILSITTASGRKVPLNRRRLFEILRASKYHHLIIMDGNQRQL